MRLALLLLSLCIVAGSASAKDLFRCTTAAGAVEYQDSPCSAGGTGRKVSIVDDTPTVADQIAAEKKMTKLRQEASAVDARLAAQAKARQRAREAEDRQQRAAAERAAQNAAAAEPQVVYVPYGVPVLTTPTYHHHHEAAAPQRAIVQSAPGSGSGEKEKVGPGARSGAPHLSKTGRGQTVTF